MVPETPLWLLSKNRKDDALKSLQWLRGWVKPELVQKEFREMQSYSATATSCVPCQKGKLTCSHPPPTIVDLLKELIRKRTLKPFVLVMICFAISQFTGATPMRPYMIQLFQTYRVPIDPNWATVRDTRQLKYYMRHSSSLVLFYVQLGCHRTISFSGERHLYGYR